MSFIVLYVFLIIGFSFASNLIETRAIRGGSTGTDQFESIDIDSQGNIYLGGRVTVGNFGNGVVTSHSGGGDAVLVKYTSGGVAVFAVKGGSGATDRMYAIKVDASGNIYGGGNFTSGGSWGTFDSPGGSGGEDAYIVQVNSSGVVQRADFFTGNTQNDSIQSIAIGLTGEVYAVGNMQQSIYSQAGAIIVGSGAQDGFLIRYTNTGAVVRDRRIGGATNDTVNRVHVDRSGFIYVAGTFFTTVAFEGTGSTMTSSGGFDAMIIKYNSNGDIINMIKGGGTSNDEFYGVASDSNNNIYGVGYFTGTASFGSLSVTSSGLRDPFVVKYSSTGVAVWLRKGGGSFDDNGYDIRVDSFDNVYVIGAFSGSATFGGYSFVSSGENDAVILKFSSGGQLLKATKGGGSSNGFEYHIGINQDLNNTLYAVGTFESSSPVFGPFTLGNSGNTDLFLVNYGDQCTGIRQPDAFSFTGVTGISLNTFGTSGIISFTNVTTGSLIHSSGGLEFSISGGIWTSGTASLLSGTNTIQVRLLSAGTFSTTRTGFINVGGLNYNTCGTTQSFSVTTEAQDTTPNSFSFNAITNAALNSGYSSNTVTITGINTGSTISVSGGLYRINAGAFTGNPGLITSGQTVTLFLTSANAFSTLTSAILNIGGVTGAFNVTTTGLVLDDTPDPFSFNTITGAILNSGYSSNAITVTGINTGSIITISGGLYRINAGAFTGNTGLVSQGDTVTLFLTSANAFSTTGTSTLTIGGVTGNFFVVTLAEDTTPNSFSFNAITNAALNSGYSSNTVTITGINTGSTISVSGGLYRINGGGFTSSVGIINSGDNVALFLTSANNYATLTSVVLTIGGVTGAFNVTTSLSSGDSTPDSFGFNTITGAALSSGYISNAITITGIDTSSMISITNGLYSIDGGTYTGNPGVVTTGQLITVFLTSANNYSTLVSAILDIGGVTGAFHVTTTGADLIPDPFSFSSITDASLNSGYTSNGATISGIDTGTVISISRGMYKIGAGGGLTAATGLVQPGETVFVYLTSANSFSTLTSTVLTVGGVTGLFEIITVANSGDSTPNNFSFTPIVNATISTQYESNSITISGIDTGSIITVSAGEYKINAGSYTSSAGTVFNGDSVTIRLTSSSSYSTSVSTTVNIGGVTGAFNITTQSGTVISSTPSGGGGGGGGGSRISAITDKCPNGDNSPSYYDGTCLGSTTTVTNNNSSTVSPAAPSTPSVFNLGLPVEYNNFFSQINADQQKACLVVPSQLSNEQVLVKRVFEKFIDQYGNDPSTIASKIATMVGKINNYLTGEVAKSGQNITLINRLNFYKLLSIKKIQKLQLQSSSSSFNAQSLNDQFTQFNITDFGGLSRLNMSSSITREQAARFYSEFMENVLCAQPKKEEYECIFSDLEQANPSLRDSIVKACRYGVFQGFDDGSFGPKKQIKTKEVYVTVMRMLYGNTFPEIRTYEWAQPYLSKAQRIGLTNMYPSNTAFNQSMTIDQFSQLLLKSVFVWTE